VLLPAGALLVHQLRYLLAYGSQASDQLGAQGHAYLGSLVPWIVLVAGGGLGCFIARLARAWRVGSDGSSRRAFWVLWATTAGSLVAVYCVQELLEGLFAAGHPPGLAGIFGHGGWWSLPAAAAVSLLTVMLLRVGRALVQLAARSRGAAQRRSRRGSSFPLSAVLLLTGGRPLASAAAGRAPPERHAG
jgi:hypothetical protein